ncbi:Aste57867_10355 [Aphanomyces stellatus]|uniref:Aste57867_10355 protein n=1 Tax=Aphanomyces stellatus TaxID=120398 RepID=A0A485KQ78_9STRA|nr:hypothetical protein As57867_010315 [Aphanomyces stellatus]VFT87229.1 Aste57867_10355 [Aphanomyces stellatus]
MTSAALNGRRRSGKVDDFVRLPNVRPMDSSFPSPEERVQLQDIGEQSCRYLKRLAYSASTIKREWDVLETETNMEMYQIKDKSTDTLVNICGIASVHASLADVANAVNITGGLPNDDTRAGPPTFVDQVLASKTLVRIDFRNSAKWIAVRSLDPATMPHRDFVVLHSCDRFEDVDTRGVVISLHSLDFPGAPMSFENAHSTYPFIRGGMYRSGMVLLEHAASPGVIDIVSVFKVDFKGNERQSKAHRSTLTSWLAWMGDMNKVLLCDKLRKVGAPRLRRTPAAAASSSHKARQCESCDKPFKFQFRKATRHQCMMCSAVLCAACTVEFEESSVNVMLFCIPCCVKWNPDGPSIKFIQPVHLMPESTEDQIKLRSQMHNRFSHSGEMLPPTPLGAAPPVLRPPARATPSVVDMSHRSVGSVIPILGDNFDDLTPPGPQSALSTVALHRLDMLVQIDQPDDELDPDLDPRTNARDVFRERSAHARSCFLVDGLDTLNFEENATLRHTAIIQGQVPMNEPPAADLHGRLAWLRRQLHESVAAIVRESSAGHKAAAKAHMLRRAQLKTEMKDVQDTLLAAPHASDGPQQHANHALQTEPQSLPPTPTTEKRSSSAKYSPSIREERHERSRASSSRRGSAREDLRATQVELVALRQHQDVFSKDSIDRLDPQDIAALQAKLDNLLNNCADELSVAVQQEKEREQAKAFAAQEQTLRRRRLSSNDAKKGVPALALPKSRSTGAIGDAHGVRFSDIQIFTASNKRMDVHDLRFVDDIHSFAL